MLRPQFTHTLVETLKKQSVNVYGEAGQGQDRLVKDVTQLMRTEDWLVLYLDMNCWKENYQSMVDELYKQVRRALPDVPKTGKSFSTLVSALDKYAPLPHCCCY